jgi:hypothetical protein
MKIEANYKINMIGLWGSLPVLNKFQDKVNK